jgi:hypothetical protein
MSGSPFAFASQSGLVRWTGHRADDLPSFLVGLEKVSGSSIYYHFFESLYRHHYATTDFTHDFARWMDHSLRLPPLAERLAQVDPTDYSSIRAARERMIEYVRRFIGDSGRWFNLRAVAPFYFLEVDSFIYPTGHVATDLASFGESLRQIGEASVYYHLFAARIRLGRQDNDFSIWLETELGEQELAAAIRRINVHRRPIGVTRARVVAAIDRRRGEIGAEP